MNHFRIFESVYRNQGMTLAAKELHLTQSGVSQHILSLENTLKIRLFDRIKKRLVPTPAAHLLFQKCRESFHAIEEVLATIQGEVKIAGKVSIGMPPEFGNNILLPILSEIGRKNPALRFSLQMGLSNQMSDLLLGGWVDFAFVDAFGVDRRLEVRKVFGETLQLCALKEIVHGKITHDAATYERFEYVDYQPEAPVLEMWFKQHLGKTKLRYRLRATVPDVHALARLVTTGMGVGVLPGHMVSKLESEGHKLYVFKGSGKPLTNVISVAQLQGRTRSPAAQHVHDEILKRLKA